MTAIAPRHRESLEAKAERLIRDGRCHEITSVPGRVWVGVIVGDTGRHLVTEVADDALLALRLGTGSVPPRSSCDCRSFSVSGFCSHTHAALRLRIASTPVEDLFAEVAA